MIVLSEHEKRPPTPVDDERTPTAKPERQHTDQRQRRFRWLSLLILCSIMLLYKTLDFTSGHLEDRYSLKPWNGKDHHRHEHYKGKRPQQDHFEKLFLCAMSLLRIQQQIADYYSVLFLMPKLHWLHLESTRQFLI